MFKSYHDGGNYERQGLESGTARSVGKRFTHRATRAGNKIGRENFGQALGSFETCCFNSHNDGLQKVQRSE